MSFSRNIASAMYQRNETSAFIYKINQRNLQKDPIPQVWRNLQKTNRLKRWSQKDLIFCKINNIYVYHYETKVIIVVVVIVPSSINLYSDKGWHFSCLGTSFSFLMNLFDLKDNMSENFSKYCRKSVTLNRSRYWSIHNAASLHYLMFHFYLLTIKNLLILFNSNGHFSI